MLSPGFALPLASAARRPARPSFFGFHLPSIPHARAAGAPTGRSLFSSKLSVVIEKPKKESSWGGLQFSLLVASEKLKKQTGDHLATTLVRGGSGRHEVGDVGKLVLALSRMLGRALARGAGNEKGGRCKPPS